MCVITQTKLLCLLIPVYQKNPKTLGFLCEGISGYEMINKKDLVLCVRSLFFTPHYDDPTRPVIYIWDSYSRPPPLPKSQIK